MKRFLISFASGLAAGIFFFAWHPFCNQVSPTILKPGKIDSSTTVHYVPPVMVTKPYDSIHVRDSFIVKIHWKDSIRPGNVAVKNKVPPAQYDTIKDTSFHFYGASVKDARGDSDYMEIGSASFPAKKPLDLTMNAEFYPAQDTSVHYRQVDTLKQLPKPVDNISIGPCVSWSYTGGRGWQWGVGVSVQLSVFHLRLSL